MSGRCACCTTFLSGLTRLFTALVAVFGIALIVYGSYFAVKSAGMTLPAGVALGLGVIDLVGGLWLATCGYRQLCALRFFLLVNGLLLLAELVVAILFVVPAEQQTIIDKMQLQPVVRQWVEDNIAYTTYILLAAIGIKVVAAFFVAMKACGAAEGFDESAYGAAPRRAAGREALLDAGGDPTATAIEARSFDRYREKNAGVYEKYQIKRDGFRN